MKKQSTGQAPLSLRVYASALTLPGWLLFPGAFAFAALALYMEGARLSTLYEIVAAVVTMLGMGVGALKWARAIFDRRVAAALGLCVVVALVCGFPAWVYFAAGDAGLGWWFAGTGLVIIVPLLIGCFRNWKALKHGSEIYPD